MSRIETGPVHNHVLKEYSAPQDELLLTQRGKNQRQQRQGVHSSQESDNYQLLSPLILFTF